MKIVVKEPRSDAEVREVESIRLRGMQEIVGGYVEVMPIDIQGVDMWLNEEGKLNGLAENVGLQYDGKVFDVVVGPVLFTSMDDEGETIGLNDEQVDALMSKLNNPEEMVMFQMGGLAGVVPVLDIA